MSHRSSSTPGTPTSNRRTGCREGLLSRSQRHRLSSRNCGTAGTGVAATVLPCSSGDEKSSSESSTSGSDRPMWSWDTGLLLSFGVSAWRLVRLSSSSTGSCVPASGDGSPSAPLRRTEHRAVSPRSSDSYQCTETTSRPKRARRCLWKHYTSGRWSLVTRPLGLRNGPDRVDKRQFHPGLAR